VKVVVADSNLLPFRELLTELTPANTTISMYPRFDAEAVVGDLPDAEVFVGPKFTLAMGTAARRLRLVQVAGAGTDGVDRTALPAGVACANTFHHGQSIAEYVAMALIMLNRGILAQDSALRAGQWHSSVYDASLVQPSTLAGQTVGLVGFGHNGTLIWNLLRRFAMRGIAVAARNLPDATAHGLDWIGTPDRLSALLTEADAVVLSVPLGPETEGMIGAAELRAMKSSAVLVNIGRGPLIDEQALFEALRDREIGAAALDVWYRYPQESNKAEPSRFPFGQLDNVLMTPHVSGVTADTFRGRVADIAGNITRLANNQPLKNLVVHS
jgi:phosphoglycerate dehydrogenase-like enzyme